MTQPQRVIYLPPGVAAPAPASPASTTAGVPFDRAFFEHFLPQAIHSFCSQTECPLPVLQLLTADGITHHVNAIAGLADNWVALQTSTESHQRPAQVFVPYNTIFRVEVHSEPESGRGHMGFLLSSVQHAAPEVVTRATGKKK